MDKQKVKITPAILAALIFFMVGSAGTYENPAMQVIIDHWSQLGVSVSTIRMMTTIQSIVALPLILLIGAVVGKKISYRLTAILAAACVVIGGLGPFFLSGSWTLVLFFRALIGVGVGLAASRTPLLLASVPREAQPRFMGIAQGVSVCVGLISGPIVGMLSNISWRHTFLINIYTVLVLAMMFLIREPAQAEEAAADAGEKSAGTAVKSSLNPKVFLFAVIQMLATGVTYPAIMGISTYLAGHGIGSATMAGTILMLYALGCVAVSSLGAVQKIFRRFTMSFCFLLLALAYVLLIVFPSVPTAFIALFLVGFGFMGEFSLMQVYCGASVSADRVPMATSLLLTGNQLGAFISAFIMTFSHSLFHMITDADSTFAFGAIAFAVCAALAAAKGLLVPKDAA